MPKANRQAQKDKEQAEEKRIEQVHKDYEDYKTRIEARIAARENEARLKDGLKPLEVAPYDKWVRKAKRTIDGVEAEIEVSGDSGETKHEKFIRLGKARMENALASLDLIINLASPQYEATDKDIEKMVNALNLKVKDIETSFKSTKPNKPAFDF